MSEENKDNNVNIELPAAAGNSPEEVKMEVPSQADQINQVNNVLPEQPVVAPQPVVQQSPQPVQNPYMTPQPVNNVGNGQVAGKKIDLKIIIPICIAVVIVLVLVLTLLLGSGSEKVVKKFSKYYVKGDHQKIVEVYHDDFKDSYYTDVKDTMKKDFKNREDKDIVYKSYKILDKFKYDKETLDDQKKLIEKAYDIDEDDIKGAISYLVKYKVDNDGENAVDYQRILTIKVKGKWYIFSMPTSSIY